MCSIVPATKEECEEFFLALQKIERKFRELFIPSDQVLLSDFLRRVFCGHLTPDHISCVLRSEDAVEVLARTIKKMRYEEYRLENTSDGGFREYRASAMDALKRMRKKELVKTDRPNGAFARPYEEYLPVADLQKLANSLCIGPSRAFQVFYNLIKVLGNVGRARAAIRDIVESLDVDHLRRLVQTFAPSYFAKASSKRVKRFCDSYKNDGTNLLRFFHEEFLTKRKFSKKLREIAKLRMRGGIFTTREQHKIDSERWWIENVYL